MNDKIAADKAAVDAMRILLPTVEMDGTVVAGDGEKDNAPCCIRGRKWEWQPPQVDIALDPIEGTSLVAMGEGNAISAIGIAPSGTMFDPGPWFT